MHSETLWNCLCSVGKEYPFRSFLSVKPHTEIHFLSHTQVRYTCIHTFCFFLFHFSHGNVISLLCTSWKAWGPTPALIPLQIKMLTDRKRELEHRLSAMMEENDLLQGTVEELQDRVLILERQSHDKDLQVRRQQ